jgi:hypothetical protein
MTFLEPVDMTSLSASPGSVIEFDDRSCVVCVNETLKRATDCATREYIKDSEHSRHKKHTRTLQNKENTKFVSFDIETGFSKCLILLGTA